MTNANLLFLYTIVLAFILSFLFPALPLLYFVPFLVIQYYRYPLSTNLWLAFICGTCVDLLAFNTTLGTYAIIYCMNTFLLYRTRLHLFEHRLSTWPIMTFCFAALGAILQMLLYYIMGRGLVLSWEWIKSDLVLMPLQDAIYALIAFSIPSHIMMRWRII